jgi:hypothetical protein
MKPKHELAKSYRDIYELAPQVYDAQYGLKKKAGTDSEITKELAWACVDDPETYDRLYGRPRS